MNKFDTVIFLAYKPMLIYIIGIVSLVHELQQGNYTYSLYWVIFTVLSCFMVLKLEFYLARKWLKYRNARKENKSQILEECSYFLESEFKICKVEKNKLVGSFNRKGFEQVFTIKPVRAGLKVNVQGNFPFPISIFNWFTSHNTISNVLATHAYRRA